VPPQEPPPEPLPLPLPRSLSLPQLLSLVLTLLLKSLPSPLPLTRVEAAASGETAGRSYDSGRTRLLPAVDGPAAPP
jgi:hypothetical protein